jgi:hypothetical protein
MFSFAMMVWPVLVTAPALAVNILTNPGFEAGVLLPWFQDRDFTPSEPEDWNVTSADAHSGAFSATVLENKEIRQNIAAVATDDVVEISFWLKQPQNPVVELSFVSVFYDDGSSDGRTFISGDRDPQRWAFFDVTSLLDPGKNLTGFSVFGETGSPGPFRTFLDDLKIETTTQQVPEPGTIMLLIVGLAVLAMGSRRIRAQRASRTRRAVRTAPRPATSSSPVEGSGMVNV